MRLKEYRVSVSMIAALLVMAACREAPQSAVVSTSAVAAIANLEGLSPGWNSIEPGGDTICSDGSPYKFFVRPGAADKLMVYFQGGGACWDGGTCDADLKPTYYVNLNNTNPDGYGGIFRFENPDNPLKDHSVVFAPYCTADVHIGDAIAHYVAPAVEEHEAHSFEIQHKGFVNAEAVLDWTKAHFFKPAEIFVAGSSAGSIPSPFYAMRIAGHYPQARVAQLGDASGGYRMDGSEVRPHDQWGTIDRLKQFPGFEDIDRLSFDYAGLYIVAAGQQPNINFAQYDAAEDKTQKYFLSLGNREPPSLLSIIKENQIDIRGGVRNFHSYIAGGDLHTILVLPEFYAYHVGGVTVRDWVAALVNGEAISDVQCSDCAEAEVTDGFVSQR